MERVVKELQWMLSEVHGIRLVTSSVIWALVFYIFGSISGLADKTGIRAGYLLVSNKDQSMGSLFPRCFFSPCLLGEIFPL